MSYENVFAYFFEQLLGPHRDWIVKHTPNDRNGLYIALVINFVLFATQLLGLTAISNESKIKAE